ncbi:MAG: AMP-binding protein [Verrucomicrobiales bacterium]
MAKTSLSPSSERFWKSSAPASFLNRCSLVDDEDLLAHPDAGGLIFFHTSGSAGGPKVVALTREALLASADGVNAFLGVSAEDRWLRVLPIFHVGGFSIHARAWLSQTPLWCDDEKWNPERFASQCHARRITLTSLVPAQVHDLMTAKLPAPSSLRAVIVGGSELRPALWHRALELGWPLLTSYGLTEAGSQVATLQPGHDDPGELSVLDHWEVRLSKRGSLCLKGAALFFCYFVRQDGRWVSQRTGEWFETTDRVRLRENGGRRRLRFLGRRDRVIKILGEAVDLDQLEARLADLATSLNIMGRARLLSVPDERREHTLVLEYEAGIEGPALLRAFNDGLPRFAQAQGARETPKIRRSPLGKPMA